MEQENGLDALHNFAKKSDERAAEWLQTIEDMLGDYDEYGWAEDTLVGIYDYIMENNAITDKQIQAVQNIQEGARKRRW